MTADGFQLKIRARNAGTTTVKVTASRSGQISKSTTFKVIVSGNSSGSEDKVIIRKISDQIMNRGSERIINVNTDGSSIKASSSNSSRNNRLSSRGTSMAWNDGNAPAEL